MDQHEAVTTPVAGDLPDRARLQRRTVRTLAISQIIAGVGVATGFGVATLLAAQLADSITLVGFELTASTLGSAVAATLLAALADRKGRRHGLVMGYLLGAVGAVICVLGAVADSFWIYLVGMACYGFASAAGFQARFAAGDLASEQNRGRAVSFVLWSGTIGSIAGPNLAGAGAAVARAIDIPDLSGVFLFSLAGFLMSAALITVRLRPDPLLTARADAEAATGKRPEGGRHWRQALAETFASPGARLSVVALSTSQLVMVSLMSMTMLHIGHHSGHDHGTSASLGLVGLIFSIHLAGMSGFSPVFGWAADRLGRPPALLLGLALSGVALLLLGTSPAMPTVQSAAGMLLLGLGWSCVLVTGSTLLSESIDAERRLLVQGLSDTLMLVCGACGTAASGIIVSTFGYPTLNAIGSVALIPALLLTLSVVWGGRRAGLRPASLRERR